MRSRSFCLSCTFAVLFMCSVVAQSVPDFQSSIASPNDDASIKSIQSSMSYYNGVMNIQIPIYTLSEFGMTVPIQLHYKTSGIKVDDAASAFGLGWNFSAGGKITRIIRRKPDETEDKGYCNGTKRTTQEVYKTFFDNWNSGRNWDHDPDLFYFETPTHSGLFVCDNMGNVHTIPYQSLNIKWVDKTYFKIKDNQGNEYIFGDNIGFRETSVSTVKNENPTEFTSAWLLSRIENQFGSQILFFYQSGDAYTIEHTREQYIYTIGPYTPGSVVTKNDIQVKDKSIYTTVKNPKYLSRIQGRTAALEFYTSQMNNRTQARKYDRINICNGSEISIKFNYSYFLNDELRLDAIYRYNANGREKEKIASFKYCTSPNLPDRKSKDFDHWGYYNGKNNTTFFPAFVSMDLRAIFEGADRTPNLYYAKANTLTRIDYGSGGYEAYEYELNECAETFQTVPMMGGLRIRKITRSDGIKNSTTSLYYELPTSGTSASTISSGRKLGENPLYAIGLQYYAQNGPAGSFIAFSHRIDNNFNFQNAPVEYSYVREVLPNGSYNIYEYLTGNDPESADVKGQCYVKRIYGSPSIFEIDVPQEMVPKTSHFWRRGLLSKSSHYDANNNLIRSTTNTYKFSDVPKIAIESYMPVPEPPTPFDIKDPIRLYKYLWKSEPVFLVKTETEAGPYNTRSVVQYEYDTTYMVPTRIKETDGMGNETVKRISYPFHFTVADTSINTHPDICALSLLKERKIVVPLETIVTKNGRIVQGEYTAYKIGQGKRSQYDYVPVPAKKSILALQNPVDEEEFTSFEAHDLTIRSDNRYIWQQVFDYYNSDGQLLAYQTRSGDRKAVIYGAAGETIAEIDNAVASVPFYGQYSHANQVFYTGFERENSIKGVILTNKAKLGNAVYSGAYQIDLRNFRPGDYLVNYWKSMDMGETWTSVTENVRVTAGLTAYTIGGNYYVDEIRMLPHNACMKTCNYLLGIGKISETDVNGLITYYQYDDFGRLTRVLNNDRNPIKSYEYHLRNE